MPLDAGRRPASARGARLLQLRGKDDWRAPRFTISRIAIVAAAHDAGAKSSSTTAPTSRGCAGADGVHVGQTICRSPRSRGIVGPDAIVGLSTHDRAAGRRGAREPTSRYIAVGPCFRHATQRHRLRRRAGSSCVRYAARPRQAGRGHRRHHARARRVGRWRPARPRSPSSPTFLSATTPRRASGHSSPSCRQTRSRYTDAVFTPMPGADGRSAKSDAAWMPFWRVNGFESVQDQVDRAAGRRRRTRCARRSSAG